MPREGSCDQPRRPTLPLELRLSAWGAVRYSDKLIMLGVFPAQRGEARSEGFEPPTS